MVKLVGCRCGSYDGLMHWRINRHSAGLTALEHLQRRLPAAPGGYLRQLLRRKKCLRNGLPLAPDQLLNSGDLLALPDSERLQQLSLEAPPLVICYETEELLIADKPAGLAVHKTAEEENNLADLLQQVISRRAEPYRLAPVTRLDRGTSGLVTFAKGRKSAGMLGRQVMAHSWHKRYLALASGHLGREGQLHGEVRSHGKLRQALASYRPLHSAAGWSLVEVTLQTGRTHQVRQQLAALGHPLAGDLRYGGIELAGRPWPFLHCLRLQIPLQDKLLDISTPLPDDLLALLRTLWDQEGIGQPPGRKK